MTRTLSTVVASIVALVAFAIVPTAASAQSQNSCTTNNALFSIPGNHTFTVPAGVTEVRVTAVGGGGGGGAGAGGWGSGGGGGCGGGVVGGTMQVTPGQVISLYVGAGGVGGNGSQQCPYSGFPWCGTHYAASNGNPGASSGTTNLVAPGGGWGRTGFYNLFNNHTGGSGGGSGGGGGGNGWPGFYRTPGNGGTAGGQTNNQGAGGYCTGGGWQTDLSSLIKNASYAPGSGGYAPGSSIYWGGGGGGGLVIGASNVKGGDGQSSPGNGGKGYGGGGGGSNLDNLGVGGSGASGAVYIEWDGSASGGSCTVSCSVTFDENPPEDGSTMVRWNAPNATLFFIKNIGYVSASGSAEVSAAGDYSGFASGITGTAYCPAVLTGASQCTAASNICSANGSLINACGETTQCPFGCSFATNQCNTSCQASYICDASGTKVVNSCSSSVIEDCATRGGGWTCSGGACVPPGPPTFEAFGAGDAAMDGNLTARPSLVPPGAISTLYWNVKNAASCLVSGTNGDSWTDLFSGAAGKASLPITGQVVYTLTCLAFPGVSPASITESVTVRTVPVFQEL